MISLLREANLSLDLRSRSLGNLCHFIYVVAMEMLSVEAFISFFLEILPSRDFLPNSILSRDLTSYLHLLLEEVTTCIL